MAPKRQPRGGGAAVPEESAAEGDVLPCEGWSRCAGCLCRCFQALNQPCVYCAAPAQQEGSSRPGAAKVDALVPDPQQI